MIKENLLQLIIDTLCADLAVLLKAAKAAHEASIHEENVPDNKYDTLSLEASYIAQAQANRAQEIKVAIEAYKNLQLRQFDQDSAIYLTALVTLEDEEGAEKIVFVGPEAGGLKVSAEGDEITVITPNSPVGRGVIGKYVGDVVELRIGNTSREFEVVELC